MKVNDNGGKSPNLVSQDGRKLKVVHLQDDKTFYDMQFQASWIIDYLGYNTNAFYLDNKLYALPDIP